VITEQYLEVGYNFRMTDIQAAVGIEQLNKLDWMLEERKKIAYKYHEAFKELEYVSCPIEPEGCSSNYQSYSITLGSNCPVSRDDMMQMLLDKGVSTRRGIMLSHKEPAYRDHPALVLPISEDLSANSVLLPLYVPMSDEEVNYVIDYVIQTLN